MHRVWLRRGLFWLLPASLLWACKREDAPPQQPQPPAPAAWTAAPQPTAQPTAPPPTAQPAVYAPACEQPEGTCAWARCNMALKRCSWPCGGDADCVAGARCLGPPGFSQCVGNLTGSPR